MNRPGPIWARAAAVVLLSLGVFGLLIESVRSWEAVATVAVLEAFGVEGAVSVGSGAILVLPADGGAFVALVTRGCSSLTSIVTVVLLVTLIVVGRPARKAGAAAAVTVLIVCANIIRLTVSVAVGIAEGSSALVLFHNWAAAMFAFMYIFLALVLGIAILLPRTAEAVPVESTT